MDIPTMDKWRFYKLPSGTVTLDELGNDGGWYEYASFTPEQAQELYATLKECVDDKQQIEGERSKWKRCQCQAVFVGKDEDSECPDCQFHVPCAQCGR